MNGTEFCNAGEGATVGDCQKPSDCGICHSCQKQAKTYGPDATGAFYCADCYGNTKLYARHWDVCTCGQRYEKDCPR